MGSGFDNFDKLLRLSNQDSNEKINNIKVILFFGLRSKLFLNYQSYQSLTPFIIN